MRGRVLVSALVAAAVVVVAVLNWTSIDAGSDSLVLADREWLLLAGSCTAGLWVAGAASQLGAIDIEPPKGRLLATQVAASFANHVLPAGVGGMSVNLRFLRRQGMTRGAAVGAVALSATATGVTHALLLAGFALTAPALVARLLALAHLHTPGWAQTPGWAGGQLGPATWPRAAAALLVVLALVLVLVGTRRARSTTPNRQAGKVLRGVVAEAARLRRVARTPGRAAQLWVGSASGALLHSLALFAVLRSLSPTVPATSVVVVYLAGSALSALVPAPGAVGPLDLILVGGLAGTGLPTATAVAGVVGYRLVTVWLPLVPAAIVFAELARRRVI